VDEGMAMSQVQQLTKRCSKRVFVTCIEQGKHGWFSNNLQDVIEWLTEQLHHVPWQCREQAICEWDVLEYDVPYVRLSISYDRPETNDEMESRVQQEREAAQWVRQKELELLEQLELKYRNRT
jgi:hypothetical protein